MKSKVKFTKLLLMYISTLDKKLQLTMYKQWIKLPFEPRQFAFLFWQYQ